MNQDNITPVDVFNHLNRLNYDIVYYKLGQTGHTKEKIMRMQRECLQFIAISATNKIKGRKFTPSRLVDEFWHNMIMSTKQYRTEVANICSRYVDHLPNKSKEQNKYNYAVPFWNTIEDYEKYFGELDLEIWGLIKRKVEVKP